MWQQHSLHAGARCARVRQQGEVCSYVCTEEGSGWAAADSSAGGVLAFVDIGAGVLPRETDAEGAARSTGGEAQRVKLASELAKRSTGHTIYLLDEPTTGLHFEDVRRLLTVLSRLVDQGNTVLVIEHSLDVIKTADWIIDLGPEGGSGGGLIVAAGPPEVVAKTKGSYTGHYLKPMLGL